MTKQQHPQPAPSLTAPVVDSDSDITRGPSTEDLSIKGLSTEGLISTEDLDIERAELDRAWAEFSRVRASVGEVMSDDELRGFGINVEALDERP